MTTFAKGIMEKKMRVTCLGTGTIVPNEKRNPSGYLFEHKGTFALFDMGPGILSQLAKIDISPVDIDEIFITHFHLDHINDLPAFFFGLRCPELHRTKPLVIYGPPGLIDLIDGYRKLFPGWMEPKGFELSVNELTLGKSLETEEKVVIPFHANHSRKSLTAFSYRVECKESKLVVAYSGDTAYCDEIVACCSNANLAILDCSTLDAQKTPQHMTPTECGKVVKEAQVEMAILTHLYPSCFAAGLEEGTIELTRCFEREAGFDPIIGHDFMIWEDGKIL